MPPRKLISPAEETTRHLQTFEVYRILPELALERTPENLAATLAEKVSEGELSESYLISSPTLAVWIKSFSWDERCSKIHAAILRELDKVAIYKASQGIAFFQGLNLVMLQRFHSRLETDPDYSPIRNIAEYVKMVTLYAKLLTIQKVEDQSEEKIEEDVVARLLRSGMTQNQIEDMRLALEEEHTAINGNGKNGAEVPQSEERLGPHEVPYEALFAPSYPRVKLWPPEADDSIADADYSTSVEPV